MNGRLYDPVVGRFLNADPFIQDAGNTQNYNRYSYCLNNPLKYADPSGNIYEKSFKNFMDEMYGTGNYGYRGEAPGTWGSGGFGRGGFNQDGGDVWRYGASAIGANGTPVQNGKSSEVNFDVVYNGNVKILGDGSVVHSSNGDYWAFTLINNEVAGGGGGVWFTAADWTNNGIGGFGTGMSNLGGNFRINNTKGFSPKFYTKPNAAGKIFNGGFGITTYNTTKWGSRIGKGSLVVTLGLGAYSINKVNITDGRTFGYNTQVATAQTIGGIGGAVAGAQIGAAVGIWFGGVGTEYSGLPIILQLSWLIT